ncbi:MAG: 30S ribosomal protein S12 methylthiotransferase RimO [bacterium]|nr:30S ribosomal protein S12 methylthiotransferase RimO [bacterium]
MARIKVYLESLGCSKNLVDSEALLGLLPAGSFRIQPELPGADLIILNTCSFIADAREQSVNRMMELAVYRQEHDCRLVIWGCLPERYAEELLTEVPEIDLVAGVGRQQDVVDLLADLTSTAGSVVRDSLLSASPASGFEGFTERPLLTPPHLAYIKIAEGCNRGCSFCAIPAIRGRFRSRSRGDIVDEARNLVGRGVREINLICQDTAWYGRDLDEGGLLPLVTELGQIEDLTWIRIFYLHPALMNLEQIVELYSQPKVVPYLDLPIQHASDKMLKLMRRGHTRATLEELLTGLRYRVPNLVLRSTVLVGHPGETDEDFEELLDLIEAHPFDKLGIFGFSAEENTHAASLTDLVPPEVIAERIERIQVIQMAISEELNVKQIGRRLTGFVEAIHGASEGLPEYLKLDPIASAPFTDARAAIRTERDAYEVDGHVFLTGADGLKTGDEVTVEITEADVYDLKGKIVNDFCLP